MFESGGFLYIVGGIPVYRFRNLIHWNNLYFEPGAFLETLQGRKDISKREIETVKALLSRTSAAAAMIS